MSNTTFRRRYPDISREIGDQRSSPPPVSPGRPSPYYTFIARNAKLRRANRELADQLKLAVAHIQYLALHNARLQAELETYANVTPLTPRIRKD